MTVDPTSAFLGAEHICSYMLTVDNYREGDMIEVFGLDSYLTEIPVFFGGYSPVTASKSIKLSNNRRYKLDGSQQQFLIVEVHA